MTTPCPVCTTQLVKEEVQHDRFFYECPTCGSYSFSGTARRMLDAQIRTRPDGRALLSHTIFKMASREQWAMVSEELLINVMRNGTLPGPQEQLDNLILWLGTVLKGTSDGVKASRQVQSAIGAADEIGYGFILEYAANRGLVAWGFQKAADGRYIHFKPISLTFDGWVYLDQLKQGNVSSRIAFMAMQFGDTLLDKIYSEHFKTAVGATGFNLKRLDEGQPAGLIDDRLRVEIRQARFLIADLTHHNKGAYWEAGYAEGLGKPVIYTCRKSAFNAEGTHFDTNHHLTVMWEPENMVEAVEKLKATIRATLPGEAKYID